MTDRSYWKLCMERSGAASNADVSRHGIGRVYVRMRLCIVNCVILHQGCRPLIVGIRTLASDMSGRNYLSIERLDIYVMVPCLHSVSALRRLAAGSGNATSSKRYRSAHARPSNLEASSGEVKGLLCLECT